MIGLPQMADVGQATFGDETETIEHLKDLARRLMYGANDRLALFGQIFHRLDDRDGHERVEAARRLVAEQYRRIRDDLGGERESSLLATTDSFVTDSDRIVLALF